MGPRSHDHGYYIVSVGGIDQPPSLQWGRGLTTTDTPNDPPTCSLTMTLQWGRGLTTTDTPSTRRRARGHTKLQWGRGLTTTDTLRYLRTQKPSSASLQWGRGLTTTDTPPGVRVNLPPITASMGPRSHDHGYWTSLTCSEVGGKSLVCER